MAKDIGVEATVLAEFGLPLADGAYADAFGYAGDIVLFKTFDAVDAVHRIEDLDLFVAGGSVTARCTSVLLSACPILDFGSASKEPRAARGKHGVRRVYLNARSYSLISSLTHEGKAISAIMPWCLKCTQNQIIGLPDLPTSVTP